MSSINNNILYFINVLGFRGGGDPIGKALSDAIRDAGLGERFFATTGGNGYKRDFNSDFTQDDYVDQIVDGYKDSAKRNDATDPTYVFIINSPLKKSYEMALEKLSKTTPKIHVISIEEKPETTPNLLVKSGIVHAGRDVENIVKAIKDAFSGQSKPLAFHTDPIQIESNRICIEQALLEKDKQNLKHEISEREADIQKLFAEIAERKKTIETIQETLLDNDRQLEQLDMKAPKKASKAPTTRGPR